MPRNAAVTSRTAEQSSEDELSMSRVDDLIQRGRSQGHLSLSDLRTAFEQAGLTPTEARSILRELSEAGVRLANEEPELLAPKPARKTAPSKATAAKAPVSKGTAMKDAAQKAAPAARDTEVSRSAAVSGDAAVIEDTEVTEPTVTE